MNDHACACGYQAATAEELGDHIGEMVIPPDDTAPDGQPHAEAARDTPKSSDTLECLCSFTGTGTDLDRHLLNVFTSAGQTGPDGATHAPASGAS